MNARPSDERLIIRNGVLYVPAWEWNSEETQLLGHHVYAQVKPAREASEGGVYAPQFTVTFDNGWVIELSLLFSYSPAANEWESNAIAASVYVGEGEIIKDIASFQRIEPPGGLFITPSQFVPVIQQIATWPPWQTTINTSRDADDALIAAYIEPHPANPDIAEYRLTEANNGYPVWSIIGSLAPNGSNAEAVLRDFQISPDALRATIAFYRRHAQEIEDRLAGNRAA